LAGGSGKCSAGFPWLHKCPDRLVLSDLSKFRRKERPSRQSSLITPHLATGRRPTTHRPFS
jgi:hypothetical protein